MCARLRRAWTAAADSRSAGAWANSLSHAHWGTSSPLAYRKVAYRPLMKISHSRTSARSSDDATRSFHLRNDGHTMFSVSLVARDHFSRRPPSSIRAEGPSLDISGVLAVAADDVQHPAKTITQGSTGRCRWLEAVLIDRTMTPNATCRASPDGQTFRHSEKRRWDRSRANGNPIKGRQLNCAVDDGDQGAIRIGTSCVHRGNTKACRGSLSHAVRRTPALNVAEHGQSGLVPGPLASPIMTDMPVDSCSAGCVPWRCAPSATTTTDDEDPAS